jgi:hypothetical protein
MNAPHEFHKLKDFSQTPRMGERFGKFPCGCEYVQKYKPGQISRIATTKHCDRHKQEKR